MGHFTIVDDKVVDDVDVGNNFFVDRRFLGKSRGESVVGNLLEMNETVTGVAVNRNPVDVMTNDQEFFSGFDLVIACCTPSGATRSLAAFLYAKSIPLIWVRSYGLFGHLRLSVPEITGSLASFS